MAEDQNRTLQDKFMLRFPEGMRERIRRAAERNGRSMNAEIIQTLEYAYPVNLSVGEFVEMLAPVMTEKDPDKRTALLDKANAEAQAAGCEYVAAVNMRNGELNLEIRGAGAYRQPVMTFFPLGEEQE